MFPNHEKICQNSQNRKPRVRIKIEKQSLTPRTVIQHHQPEKIKMMRMTEKGAKIRRRRGEERERER